MAFADREGDIERFEWFQSVLEAPRYANVRVWKVMVSHVYMATAHRLVV